MQTTREGSLRESMKESRWVQKASVKQKQNYTQKEKAKYQGRNTEHRLGLDGSQGKRSKVSRARSGNLREALLLKKNILYILKGDKPSNMW